MTKGTLPTSHMRVICLVPEAAEILATIGGGDGVVRVDGADGLRRALEAGRPDLIVASDTAAGGGVPRAEARRIVRGLGPRVPIYALEPHSVGGILSDVKTVGDAIGRQREARALIESLRARIDAVSLRAARIVAERGPRRVACLLGLDPPLVAGWWQAELVGLAGGCDVFDGVGRPPRPTTQAEIEAVGPDMVVVLRADEAVPGPHVVDVLERLAASILSSQQ